MTREFPILYLARVLIEARTPLSVGTGNADGVFDTSLVRDANDLPAIPATSLAGVLRALYAHTFGQDATHSLFGYSSTSGANNQALAFPSRVVISWGALLDSHGRAADGIIFETERMSTDPLYSIVQRQKDLPVHRNRVRLNHRGTAMDTGKFDLSILPAGHRFAFELRLWAKAEEGEGEWNRLLSLLTHRQISLHDLQKAFKNALTDLCEGRLALGARSTSGNGFFQGTFEGSLADPWPLDQGHFSSNGGNAMRRKTGCWRDVELHPIAHHYWGHGLCV